MARTGILYSHVAKAAASLAAARTNPTVDTVRAALGDTGSKSTIGPLLKRWKAEREGEAAAASTGLPADLLEAVKAVHQRIEAASQARSSSCAPSTNRPARRPLNSWRRNAPQAASCAPNARCWPPSWQA